MKKQKTIDITMWMGDFTYPGDEKFKIEGPYSAIGEEKEFCYKISTNSVDGTHIQAPHYMLKNGKKINDFDISYFRREAVLIDLQDIDGNEIPLELLKKELDKENLKNKAVIFRTGVMDKLINGKNGKDKLLPVSGVKYLIDKGVKMIITDTTCLDNPFVTDGVCHTTLLCCKNDVILVKQVCRLNKISKRNVIVEAYPLKIRGISGTPCRVVITE
ncbi:MAG: cyclase family protein [Candidatus Aenigmarchaeota archaeon]|nr:cyclase family protein [Candidatus Aenigmarchaeota archaeon]